MLAKRAQHLSWLFKHICASKSSLVNSWDRVNIPYSKRINCGNHKPLIGFCPFYSLLYNTVTKRKQKLICWDTKNVWGISQHSLNFWSLWSISWAMDHSVHHYFKLSHTWIIRKSTTTVKNYILTQASPCYHPLFISLKERKLLILRSMLNKPIHIKMITEWFLWLGLKTWLRKKRNSSSTFSQLFTKRLNKIIFCSSQNYEHY